MTQPQVHEQKALAWLWTAAATNPGLLEQVPQEILSDEGKQWLTLLQNSTDPPPDLTPASEQEGRTYFRTQLLAYLAREAAKAQHNGSLDRVYRGLAVGELGIIFLPPGRGKTQMLINFTDTALFQGKDVLYITVADQSKDELIPRIDTCILGTPCPMDASPELLAERHTHAAQQRTGRLWVADYTDRTCDIQDVERTIQQCASDLIIVDHADDVLSPYASDPTATRHSLRVVYLALKKLAVRYNVPIWTASQSPEMSWNFRATSISDMAEAKVGKATGAAIILGFSGGTPSEQVPGVMYCSIAKARRWFTERNFPLRFDFTTCRVW